MIPAHDEKLGVMAPKKTDDEVILVLGEEVN